METDPTSVASGLPEDLIDFEDQQQLFKAMLDNRPVKRLMFVQAPDGRGKTSLLRILSFHSEHGGVPYCSIDNGKQPYDSPYLTLPLAICDQLDLSPRHLARALQPLSTFSPPGDVDNPEVVSQIVAGVSLTHEGLRPRHMKERLREAFIADLGDLVEEKGRAVCLFDCFEQISVDEEDWLFDTLLWPVAKDKLKGVMIVTAGCRWPKIKHWEWEQSTHLLDGLPLMKVEHIKIYAAKVNIKITDDEAIMCWKFSGGGIPLFVTLIVRNKLSDIAGDNYEHGDVEASREASFTGSTSISDKQNNDNLANSQEVIITVHGIRDNGLWQQEIRDTLVKHNFIVSATNYGQFDLLRFLIPIKYFRRRAAAKILHQVRIVTHQNPNSKISVIAHSFGTYIVGHIIKENFDVKFNRIIFCGSVLPYDFPFENCLGRFTPDILNEVGIKDIWPAFAESITAGYGSAGTFGFNRALVYDRWHNGAHHGYFLRKEFCKKYWLPFLKDGTKVRDSPQPREARAASECNPNTKD